MATSHSGWGNCPAHKKNQLAMYPGVWCILTSVFSVISVVGMWQWVGWAVDRDPAAQARILDLRLGCLVYVCERVCVRGVLARGTHDAV